jgi:hypothetical protein
LFDYSDRNALSAAADRYGLWIFNAYPVKAAELFVDTMINHPQLLARYPRLRDQLFSENPAAAEAYEKLPDYRKGFLTVPIGKDRQGRQQFVDLNRINAFSQAMNVAKEIKDAVQERRMPKLPTGKELLGHTIVGPLVGAAVNQSPFGDPFRGLARPLVHPGAPADVQTAQLRHEMLQSALPLVRSINRQRAANAGLATSEGKFSMPQKPWEAFAQGFLGIATATIEGDEARLKRLEPDVKRRARAGEAFLKQVTADYAQRRVQNPYEAKEAQETDLKALQARLKHAQGYLRQQLTNPSTITAAGVVTDAGKGRITKSYLHVLAIGSRLEQLAREQTASR